MSPLSLRSISGPPTLLSEKEMTLFSDNLHGELLISTSPAYNTTRVVWNGIIDRKPGLIVVCHGATDVMHAVKFARKHMLYVSVRGGGHNVAGSAVCEGGLMIDLSQMKSVRIDTNKRIARVEPGCTLADLDHEAQVFGLAVPVGINSTTGIAGLTVGGGFGWLSRKYGLTIDNLISADVVTADGQLMQVNEEQHQDLFWAIRGGGGNFGIVTSFQFKLHPVGPEVLSGLIVHPFEKARQVLEFYRHFVTGLPDETSVWAVLRLAPPLPFLPQEWHGKPVVVLAAFHSGTLREGEQILAPLRQFGQPIADVIGPHQFKAWQQAFDPLLTANARNYWKSHNFNSLPDEAIDLVLEYINKLPSPHTEIFIAQVGGQMKRVNEQDTAYPHRMANFIMNVHARWETAAEDQACIKWARDFFQATSKLATGGVYVNFLTEEETDRIQNAYGSNYDRLVEVKMKYDPDNLFRANQNINPNREKVTVIATD